MLAPIRRKAIIDEGTFKKQVASDLNKVRDNVVRSARKQGASEEEIADILRELEL